MVIEPAKYPLEALNASIRTTRTAQVVTLFWKMHHFDLGFADAAQLDEQLQAATDRDTALRAHASRPG
jgi:hypothetical protein